jgi:hypothetical protein
MSFALIYYITVAPYLNGHRLQDAVQEIDGREALDRRSIYEIGG